MHAYEKARAIWMKESGGKPIDVGLNSIEASEFKSRDPARWRSSPTQPPAPAAVPARPAPLAQSSPTESDGQRRFRLDQEALTRSDPYRDPNQLLRRAPDGTITAEPRSPDPASPQPGEPPGPASVENGRLRIGEIELSEQDVRGLLERKGL